VTIARLRGTRPDAVAAYLQNVGLVSDSFTVTRFVLYSSRDSVGGGPYVVEAAYDLEDEEDDNYGGYEVDQLLASGIDS
jgi:2'-5' RNA ligase